ncbi:hypothetical protein B9N43_16225 [Denitratisoma sp. DHT3]|uniref:DUF2946 family protein n=1 Tax=Denitratisoma sp. DHT3 TaxID=1981880 RepID=UPI001198C85A|nr:DUF2946 family protein [Denitratisoma sp. DHT3]QDX82642.1 hypothetical protein B9N43_16225 [Denitratisoma sp. DHT3]
MKRCPSPILAVVLALLLLCAQQGALAHLIGHLGTAPQVAVQQDESGHGAALALADVCTTCVALSALGGPPSADFQALTPALAANEAPGFVHVPAPTPPHLRPRARAPPTASAS